MPQTQVQSLMEVVSETRIVVDKCCQDMNGFETGLLDIRFIVQEQWRKKVKIVLPNQILQPETLALRSNDLCFYTSDGAFICKDCKLYANMPFIVWLELFCCDTSFMMLPKPAVITTLFLYSVGLS